MYIFFWHVNHDQDIYNPQTAYPMMEHASKGRREEGRYLDLQMAWKAWKSNAIKPLQH